MVNYVKTRWVRRDARVYDFSTCALCGVAYGVPIDGACRVRQCLACGTEQCSCGVSSRCGVCYHGIVDGFREDRCGKKGCTNRAVALVPRIGAACAEHLSTCKATGPAGKAGKNMAQVIAGYLAEREQNWRLLPSNELEGLRS